ncbi:deoxyuridine 5'-triphosphate nucleotidohydrolase-like [Triticum dicoccoides]|uniref:deoxyuridine 5'-triphosphate nucleotidohydrolase-like n=1 Tax=Triticum dicoccoides TaxID=85692 RepID=UPI001891A634|nr:deoxyuridine 5'-triphosphate nucleotidohydrolase-like [Triticum dicoccoides]
MKIYFLVEESPANEDDGPESPPSSVDEDDHHGTHVVEFAVAYSGAVLDQGPPPQQILAWGSTPIPMVVSLSFSAPLLCVENVLLCMFQWEVRSFAAQNPTNRRRNAREASLSSMASLHADVLNKINHTSEEPPRRSNSSVPGLCLAVGKMNSSFCRIQRIAKAGWLIDADYRGPVGSVLFNDSEVDLAVKTGDRVAQMIIQMFTIVSMNVASVKDGSVT